MKIMNDVKKIFAQQPLLLIRIVLSLLYLWFGISQLINPSAWVGWVPSWATFGMSPTIIVILNGATETVAAGALLFGRWQRIMALFLGLKTLVIAATLGYNDLAIRDAALGLITMVYVFPNVANKNTIQLKR